MSDARLDDSLVYDQRDAESSVSQAFYETLKRGGLVDKYRHWKRKTKGGMQGLILLGSANGGREKVYVKRYPLVPGDFEHELIDYAVFNVMGQCGARTPKVELKIFENQAYLFSTHLAQQKQKHPDKQYWFKIFYRHKLQIDTEKKLLSLNKTLFDFGNEFKIDKIEAARVLILALILNVFDFHNGNIGMVASSAGKAKLGLVDFLVHPQKIKIDGTLLELIRLRFDPVWTCRELQALISIIEENDCVAAFKKIEENFMSACDAVAVDVSNMKFETDAKHQYFVKSLEMWKENFDVVRAYIHKLDHKLVY